MVGIRLLWSIPLLFCVTALTFVLTALTPGDAARTILGTNTDPAAYQQVRDQLHLDRPLLTQYVDWLGHALRGDLGSSLFTGESVTSILSSRLEVTMSLVLGTTLVCGLLGVGLGLLSALRGGVTARSIDGVSMVGMSLPTPWLGLVLVLVFAIQLSILPATGYVPIESSVSGWLTSLVLPIACLAAGGVALIARQTRGAVIDVMRRDYVRALRAAGLPASRVVFRHVLKNAAVPVVTTMSLLVIGLLSGTVVVEQLFALPGLGQEAVTATAQHDLPVLEGVVVYFTLLVILFNLAADIVNMWLNPRLVHA
jgi:peptide/nickel transport system permease protein